MTRILLFTGKGGVGKTTAAAATATAAAAAGHRVLITSTDPAHSLGDVFDTSLGDAPVAIAPRLQAQEIDAQARMERRWADVRDYLVELLAWGGMGEVEAEELLVLPGLDELLALIDLRAQADSGDHDVVVLDCAPTAETLRLLALPDALRWYVQRILQPGRRLARAVRPWMGGGVPIPEDGVFGAVERLQGDLTSVHAVLQDAGRTSIRLVMTPERVVINETLRTATSLSLFGYAIDAVVVNRVIPSQVDDPYLRRWKQRQADHLATISSSFGAIPVLEAPLLDDEPIGPRALATLGSALYGGGDPARVLHHGPPLRIERDAEGGHRLLVDLPFASRDDLDLHQGPEGLHVRVGATRRTIPLPATLRRATVSGAGLRDGVLEVRFDPPMTVGAPS